MGFGPGHLLNEIASRTIHSVTEGIDFSQVMVKQASQYNRALIEQGQLIIRKGDFRSLPYPDNSFDKICTVNTLYFWTEPETLLEEMRRVLKPGGLLVIGFRDREQMETLELSEDVFTTYSKAEVIELMEGAGFSKVSVQEGYGSHFTSYCVLGSKL